MNAIDIAFVTACTALLGATVRPFLSLRIAKAQIGSTVISANGQKWIDDLRHAIASFCSQAVIASLVRDRLILEDRIVDTADPNLFGRLEDLLETLHRIKLMINPSDDDHERLLSSCRRILTLLRIAPVHVDLENDVRKLVDDAVGATQAIRKKEWERVKCGA